jgi:NAD(P)-dependent dehydrogenase (short-subunit alcohol dehydrogenase family)
LVTGAAVRLGRATALALARAGADVVIHYRSSVQEARATVAEIEACGVRGWAVGADLGVEDEARRVVEEARGLAGPIDILVNSASVFPRSEFETFTRGELVQSMDVNAWAPLVLARRFVEQVEAGHIVNFLDTRAFGYDWGHVAYHASKVLLELLTREMALRWAPRFQVNAVAPGLALPPPGETADYLERLRRSNPLGRAGTPEEIAEAVLFLVRSRFVTGQVLFVDGGRHLREARRG